MINRIRCASACCLLAALLPLSDTVWSDSRSAGIPPGGTPILRDPLVHHELQSSPSNGALRRVQLPEGAGEVLELASFVEGDDWDAQMYVRPSEPVQKGDALLLTFRARTMEAPAIAGSCYVKVSFEFPEFWNLTDLQQPEHAPFLRSLMLSAGPEWDGYAFPAVATRDMDTNGFWIAFRAGKQKQTVQFSDIALHRYPAGTAPAALPESRITYPGRAANAPWRAAAEQRIRELRRRPLVIHLEDEEQEPVPGADVHVELVRHAFEFGIAFDAPRVLARFNPEWAATRNTITSLFTSSSFVNELKWQAWAGDWPEERFQRDVALEALRWIHEAGLPFRGHALVWPRRTSVSKAVAALLDVEPPDCAAIEAAIESHMKEIGEATAFGVTEWDLLNEPVAEQDLQKACGDEAMVGWFKKGRELLPGKRLAINEYGILSSVTDGKKVGQYEALIRWLLAREAPVDVIGMQGHFKAAEGIPSPERILQLLDRFAVFGKAIRATEFDVKSGDEELIRDVFRDFYTVMFSHPAVTGVQVWNWFELFREDGSLTPAGEIHRDLIKRQWHTEERGQTDARGMFSTPGFLGDYIVTISRRGEVIRRVPYRLSAEAGPLHVRTPLP